LKRLAEAAGAVCWSGLFAVAGRLAASQTSTWRARGGQRILVVAPHPDDEVCGCAGAILQHREAGDEVTVVCVTDGSASRSLGLGPQEMAARRRREAESAAARLAARLEWLGLPERTWDGAALRRQLAEYLASWRPNVIYAPSRIDFHPDHVRVAMALAGVLGAAPLDPDPLIRVYQIQVRLTPLLTNLICSIASVEKSARAVLRVYQSQLGSLLRVERMKRYAGAWHRVPGLAEPFWELSAAAYARLHRDVRPEASPFRGLRKLPISDPLCYWKGRAERRRLRQAAQEPG
jgi:LmbE family N-acetylglucosaminyl deacetylase